MKIFAKTSVLAFIVLVITNCSKDDPAPNILGMWTVQTSTLNLKVNGENLYDFLVAAGVATSQAQSVVDSYTDGFSGNGAGVIFEFKGDGLYNEFNGPNDKNPATGTWTLDKKNLTLTDDKNQGYRPTGTITSASDTDMSIDLTVRTDNSLGFEIDYVVSMVLKKSS